MPCVPGTKRPSCPDDLGPPNPEVEGSRKEEPRPAMRPGKWVSPNLGHKVTWIRGVGLRIVAIVDRDVLVRGDRAVRQNIVSHGVSPASHASKPP